jgi:hypothetical protein
MLQQRNLQILILKKEKELPSRVKVETQLRNDLKTICTVTYLLPAWIKIYVGVQLVCIKLQTCVRKKCNDRQWVSWLRAVCVTASSHDKPVVGCLRHHSLIKGKIIN